jgi:hypothetical protein
MDDDDAVFRRRCEQDMIASPDAVLAPRQLE